VVELEIRRQQQTVSSKIEPSLAGYGSKVLLGNKRGLCQMNRKLALRIDGSSNRDL
jgi:hypothetical protein